MFFFFSLALAKRHVEVLRSKEFGDGSLKTRGYVPEDAGLTLALGVAGGIGSLVIMVLYLVETRYGAKPTRIRSSSGCSLWPLCMDRLRFTTGSAR